MSDEQIPKSSDTGIIPVELQPDGVIVEIQVRFCLNFYITLIGIYHCRLIILLVTTKFLCTLI